jgi:hypothetical protein
VVDDVSAQAGKAECPAGVTTTLLSKGSRCWKAAGQPQQAWQLLTAAHTGVSILQQQSVPFGRQTEVSTKCTLLVSHFEPRDADGTQ